MENSQKPSNGLPLKPTLAPTDNQAGATSAESSVASTKQKLSVQQRWGQAAQQAIDSAKTKTHSQNLAQARLNSGYVVKAIHELPKPGTGASRGIRKPS